VSTNTNARTFQTKVVDLNTPSLRYNRDSSNGDNVEILVSGVYAISYCDQSQASGSNGVLAIVRNPVEPLTLDIDSQLANGRVLNLSDVFSGNNVVVVSTTLHLSAGDKVYAYTRNVLPSANNSLFRVVRVR
jgi:hypothetical protein